MGHSFTAFSRTSAMLVCMVFSVITAIAQVPDSTSGKRPSNFASIKANYGTSDTAKALVHLFRRKNRTGKIFAYASGTLLVGGGISFAVLSNSFANRGIGTLNPSAARNLLGRAWLVYGGTAAYGIVKARRWSRKRLVRVLQEYESDGQLPELYRKKLWSRDFK